MQFIETKIKGLWIIEPKVFGDERGYFFESYKQVDFQKNIGVVDFIQENEAFSTYGVLRGLHFQKDEFAQAKLVRVVQGKVLDVAVDLRENSATYGKYESIELTAENKKQFFVPRGFAHGYVVLSETAVFQYKVDNIYAPAHEAGLLYKDPSLGIDWQVPESQLLVSPKDLILPTLV